MRTALVTVLFALTNNVYSATTVYTQNNYVFYATGHEVCVEYALIRDAASPSFTITCTGVTSEPPVAGTFFFDHHYVPLNGVPPFENEESGQKIVKCLPEETFNFVTQQCETIKHSTLR